MSVETFLDGKVVLHKGDCLDVLKAMPDCCVDSVVTDPPYALVSITKRFGKAGAAPVKVKEGGTGAYARASAGFMGKAWDTGERAFAVEFWAEVWRVLKPGGHVAAFSGTRTYHRLAVAIEDAGFKIRDQLAWVYGSGFPKSHDVSKAIDRAAKAAQWQGWGTALKPAWEPICLARKPLAGTVAANVLEHGTGAINVDGCRVGAEPRPHIQRRNDKALDGDVYGSGINGSRSLGTFDQGRFPANLIHDGSEEVLAGFPAESGRAFFSAEVLRGADLSSASRATSPARFFYTAKADANDRIGSRHPTVKPVDLMQWLCRLITPPGGTLLDPFAGTGTTGEAAWREGFKAILIEREAEYQADIAERMRLALSGPDEKRREIIKRKGQASDAGPLFGETMEPLP